MAPSLPRESLPAALLRSLVLIVTTVIALVLAWGVLAVVEKNARGSLLALAVEVLAILVVGVTPFGTVLLHFRWQRPPRSSVALAFVTGLASCGLALGAIVWIGVVLFGT